MSRGSKRWRSSGPGRVGRAGSPGLRPTSSGGHYVIEEVLRAQFGNTFRDFGALRRRRNEID